MTYRRGGASYRITVENPDRVSRGVANVELDGVPQAVFDIKLVDDGKEHAVLVVLGSLKEESESRTLAAKSGTSGGD